MKIAIIEISSKSVVVMVPVSLGGLNYQPSKSDLYEEAWKSAVEDKLVDEGRKSEYEFQLLP